MIMNEISANLSTDPRIYEQVKTDKTPPFNDDSKLLFAKHKTPPFNDDSKLLFAKPFNDDSKLLFAKRNSCWPPRQNDHPEKQFR